MTHDDTMKSPVGHTELAVETPIKPKRIDAHYVSHELQHLFHLEKGFLFTVKELLLRPGKTVRSFLFEDRNKYVKPIVFLIFSALVFTLASHYFKIEYTVFGINGISFLKGNSWAKKITDWQNSHFGYTNLFVGVSVCFWVKLFFRKQQYNIFEMIVLLCYALGEAILLLLSSMLIAKLFNSAIPAVTGVAAYLLYPIWAIGQFFGEKKPLNYAKSALAFFLGLFTYVNILLTLLALLLHLLIP